MRLRLVLACVAVFVAVMLTTVPVALAPQNNGQANASTGNAVVAQQMAAMPLAFTENRGQWDERVRFRASAGGTTLWFCRDGITYEFTHRVPRSKMAGTEPLAAGGAPHAPFDRPERFMPSEAEAPVASAVEPRVASEAEPDSVETVVIHAAFAGSNPEVELTGENRLEYRCNYFLGDDPRKWRTDLPNYAAVVYRNVYPGVDLRYDGKGGALTCSYSAASESNLAQVKFQYEGFDSAHPNGNAAVTETGLGQLRVKAPWGAVLEPLSSVQADRLAGNTADGAASVANGTTSVTLVYSTYLGGSSEDMAGGIAVDQAGSAYVTGGTSSADFPTQNAYDGSFNGTYYDVFVTKLSPAGNALVYSTFLGGSHGDYGRGIAVDQAGSAYVTGWTVSADFPTQTPYDGSYNGGSTYGDASGDVFVTKLSAAGNALVYSTYLGGNSFDDGRDIAVDQTGSAYVMGNTSSTNFPAQNPYDGSYNGGTLYEGDVFVTKLSAAGNALAYSTYLGGSNSDYGRGIAVDQAGSAYVTGRTYSTDFPTQNPYDGTFNGIHDVFVTKLSPAGNALVYSTYLGGSPGDLGLDIAVDKAGSAYVTGYTFSSDFPTQNPYDGNLNGTFDAFVTKLSPAGNALVYSTYLGGSGSDWGLGIAVDQAGSAYVTGHTTSTDFPTQNPYDGSLNGTWDIFVTKLSPSGKGQNALVYSTYLGGSSEDEVLGIAVDQAGSAYVTGHTTSTDFPTQNPYDGSFNGVKDVFVVKFSADGVALDAPVITDLLDAGTGSDLVLKWTQPNLTGVTDFLIEWGTAPGVYTTGTKTVSVGSGGPYREPIFPLVEHTPYYVGIRAHNANSGQYSGYATRGPVTPNIPVVLVHGWKGGSPETWEDYHSWLTTDGFTNIWIPALNSCGPEEEDQFDKNAQTLATYILAQRGALQQTTGIPGIPVTKINIVAHSMGGLVSRRLIADRSSFGMSSIHVRSLTMLGTPNGGTLYANAACIPLCIVTPILPCDEAGRILCRGPATCELSSLNMKKFNEDYKRPSGSGDYTYFYAVAGDQCCNFRYLFGCGFTCSVPGVDHDHDGIVAVNSVFAIDLDGSYLRSDTHEHLPLNKADIFDPIVLPILRGNPPPSDISLAKSAPDSSSSQMIHTAALATDSISWTEDTLTLSGIAAATFWMYGLSAEPEMELMPPSGGTLDSALALSDTVNYEYSHQSGIVALSVINPADGGWRIRVRTHEWQDVVSIVRVSVEAQTDVRLTLYNFLSLGEPSDSVVLRARLAEGTAAVTGASVAARAVLDSDTLPWLFNLHDDGVGVDSTAGDGVYSAVFTQTQGPGLYTFMCEASGLTSQLKPFTRLAFLQTYITIVSDVQGPEEPGDMESIRISQSQPNPFNSSTRISFALPKYSYVRAVVYDILGREVARLADREMEPGNTGVVWDGRDSRGKTVGSGVYFCRLSVGSHSVTRKMVLLK